MRVWIVCCSRELHIADRGPAGQVAHDLVERAMRRAQRRADEAVRERREQRQAEQIVGIRGSAGRAAVAREHDVEHAVLGHQGVLHDDVVAAGGGEPDHVPGVLDRVLLARQEHEVLLRWPARLRHHRDQDRALAVIDIAGKAPAAAQADAAWVPALPAVRPAGTNSRPRAPGRRPRTRPAPPAETCRRSRSGRR